MGLKVLILVLAYSYIIHSTQIEGPVFPPSRHKKKQLCFGFLSVILFHLKYEDADW